MIYVINGLSFNLKDIFAAIQSRDTIISFQDLYEQLLEHENYLNRFEFITEDSVVTTNVISRHNKFLTKFKQS